MKQTVFDSIAAMLVPDALSELLGTRVRSVTQQPFTVEHRSANELFEILLEGDAGQTRLVLKEFQPARDWVMRLTHDTLTREAMLFANGIYARMPREIFVPVIAIARSSLPSPPAPLPLGEGSERWATLMRDVSAELLPSDQPLTPHNAQLLLEHLAALHAEFWNDASLQNPALGLSALQDFLTILSPARIQDEIDVGRTHPVLEMAARGWQKLFADVPKKVCDVIRAWQDNPTALLNELAAMPQTLVHGDYKLGNLGIAPSPPAPLPKSRRREQTIVLDWQDATRGAGVLDLGYFLALNARWLPFERERALEIYRNALRARGQSVSTREIEIGLLAGGALRLLWLMMLNQPEELEWWYEILRRV